MTDKRFVLINNTKPGTRSEIFDYQKKHNEGVGDELWLGEVVDMLNQLTEENYQLKQELKIYRKVANCRNCDFHDYDCGEDGDVFEICDKGKDMENGICEDWRVLE